MRSKLICNVLFLLFGVMLWACSDEPEFPDPGLDATKTAVDTVRRDTMDVYRISMDIFAPNGVEKIQVLNGRNYSVIREFAEEYRGKKELTFEYDVDLREIENDTTLLYIVKVIDRSMRSYNKGFTLNVKGFSSPVIKIVGGANVLGLVSSVFELKAQFETGLNTIASYRVLFEGNVIDEGTFPDTLMHEYKYKKVIDVEMEKEQEYELRVELTDSQATVGMKTIKLRLVEMKRPVKITVSTANGLNREYELFYDKEKNRLDSMSCMWYSSGITRLYEFKYTDEGILNEWNYKKDNVLEQEVLYTYDESGVRVKTMDYRDSDPKQAIDVVDWYEHGGVKSFYYGTNSVAVEDVHYTWELRVDGYVFSEYWNATNRVSKNNRQHCEEMTVVLIPTYFPELPNVTLSTSQPDECMRDLFFYKYVFMRSKYTYRTGDVLSSTMSYSTDMMGRLVTLRRTKLKTTGEISGYFEYMFTYDE